MSWAADQRQVTVRRADRPGDLGWVVMAHGEIYHDQFGWDSTFEALVARIVADHAAAHDPARAAGWIAEVDGERAGCVFCVAGDEPDVAKLRILLVTPRARGLGLGTRLVDECLTFARDAGYRQVTLWTNDVLVAARKIYQAFGFRLVESDRHHSFGHDLVGQNWALDL
ncbi:GNAT family N-acetyltransferase [Mycobacterium sp. NPDC003449]